MPLCLDALKDKSRKYSVADTPAGAWKRTKQVDIPFVCDTFVFYASSFKLNDQASSIHKSLAFRDVKQGAAGWLLPKNVSARICSTVQTPEEVRIDPFTMSRLSAPGAVHPMIAGSSYGWTDKCDARRLEESWFRSQMVKNGPLNLGNCKCCLTSLPLPFAARNMLFELVFCVCDCESRTDMMCPTICSTICRASSEDQDHEVQRVAGINSCAGMAARLHSSAAFDRSEGRSQVRRRRDGEKW